ncbi:hypothetical protein SLA2020_299260 [Shorea laevis]
MMAIKRSNCFHKSGRKNPCHINSNSFMIAFSIVEIIFSEIPDFDRFGWLSIVAAVMSFTYSTIGLSLAIAKVAETGKIRGSLTGISIGTGSRTQKIWRSFQALGDIAFAYSYSLFLFEIQDTLRSPPSESKTIEEPMAPLSLTSLELTKFTANLISPSLRNKQQKDSRIAKSLPKKSRSQSRISPLQSESLQVGLEDTFLSSPPQSSRCFFFPSMMWLDSSEL